MPDPNAPNPVTGANPVAETSAPALSQAGNPPTTVDPANPGAMKFQLLLAIATIALGAIPSLIPGLGVAVDLGEELIKIIQKARAAYQLHAGEPLDPSLIKPETEI